MHKVVHGLSIPLGKLGYLAPQTFGRVLSDTLNGEPGAVEARRKIPLLGNYLAGKPSDIESSHFQRSTIVSGPLDARPLSERTALLQAAAMPCHASQSSG